MTEPIDELVLKISADVAGLKAGLSQVAGLSEQLAAQSKKHGDVMTESFIKAEVAIELLKKGYEFLKDVTVEAVKKSFEQIEAQAKLADRLSVTTEFLAALRVQSLLAGLSGDTAATGFQRMERSIASIKSSSDPAAIALLRLGLNVDAIKHMKPEEQYTAISEAFGKLKTQTDRVAVATALFGRDGITQISILGKSLEEAREKAEAYGLAISRADSNKIEQAHEALTEMNFVLEGVGNKLAVKIAPLIAGIAKYFTDASKEAGGFGDVVDEVVDTAVSMIDGFRAEWDAVSIILKGIVAVLETGFATSLTVIDTMIRALFIAPFLTGLNLIKAIVKTGSEIGPHFGDIFKLVAADVGKFFAERAIDVSNLLQEIGEAMVSAGVKGGETFERAGETIRETASKVSAYTQQVANDAKKNLGPELAKLWDNVIPKWDDTKIPGLSDFTAKMRKRGVDAWTAFFTALNTPFNPTAFRDWAAKVTEIADKTAQDVAASIKGLHDNTEEATVDLARNALDARLAMLNQEKLAEDKNYQLELDALKAFYAQTNSTDAEQNALNEQAAADHQKRLKKIQQKETDEESGIKRQGWQYDLHNYMELHNSQFQQTQDFFSNIGSLTETHNKKLFEIGKIANLAGAVVSTARGVANALADVPYPYNFAAAAAVGIAGAVQIAKIASTHYGSGSGGGGGGGGSPAPAQAAAPSGVSGQTGQGQTVTIALQGAVFNQQTIRGLASQLNDFVRDGGQLAGVRVQGN